MFEAQDIKCIVISLLLMILNTIGIHSQPLSIEWQQCYGGNKYDIGYSIAKTNIGYLVLCGTSSNDGNVIGNHGKSDYWVLNIDSLGNILWSKTYGGSEDDIASQMLPLSHKEYILFGSTSSTDGDVTGLHGGYDFWIVSIDSIGNKMWQKPYGGSCTDLADKICMSSDSDYFCIGYSCSTDGDVTENKGIYDLWILKLRRDGSIKWERSLGSSNIDWGQCATATSNGGVIIGGLTTFVDGDVQCSLHGSCDSWVLKLDSTGQILWQHCYGGSNDENVNGIVVTNDGGYIFVGQTDSNDGDVSGNHGAEDVWVVKIDSLGNLIWQHCFGGSQMESVSFIKQSIDGNYYIGGSTFSNDGDVTGNHSLYPYFQDMWLLKITPQGDLLWQICFGGEGDEFLNDLLELPSGRIMLLGSTTTDNNSGDVNCNLHGPGTQDVWLISCKDTTLSYIKKNNGRINVISVFPNPADQMLIFKLNDHSLTDELHIKIFNSFGILVKMLVFENNNTEVSWITENVCQGLYYYLIQCNSFQEFGKIILLR